MIIKIYCDNGVTPKWLKKLKRKGQVELCYVPYENRASIPKQVEPSLVEYNQAGFTYNEPSVTYNSSPSDKYGSILQIVGGDKDFDVRHMDAAFKNKCVAFITSDKRAFINNKRREKLEKLLGIKIFHQQEENKFLDNFKDILIIK